MPKLLTLVEKTHPLLREIMPEVENFQDPALHEIIEDMCFSIQPEQLKKVNAAHEGAAGMAANQWGIKKRIFIFTPDGSAPEKKREVMLNPSYVPYLRPGETTPALAAAYEGCFSIPLTVGAINRFEAIIATYSTPTGEKIERLMEGWEARVFQHETDHLNGKLFDGKHDNYPGPDCLQRYIFNNKEEMNAFWEDVVRKTREI